MKQTGRCLVPTVDPATGERDRRMEPLKTLMRRRGGVCGSNVEQVPNLQGPEGRRAGAARRRGASSRRRFAEESASQSHSL